MIVICIYFALFVLLKSRTELNSVVDEEQVGDPNFDINNYGENLDLMVNKTRFKDVPKTKWKNILFWNDAYGVRTYDVGFGNGHFYNNMCPDTR